MSSTYGPITSAGTVTSSVHYCVFLGYLCESSIPTGTITIVQAAETWDVYTTTTTSLSTPTVIWGVQVNGFRIQPPKTSAATTTSGGDGGVSPSTQTGDGSGATSSSSTSTSESSKSSSSDLSTGSIVGIVMGTVSAVAAVLGLLFRVYTYKKTQKRQQQQQLAQEGTQSIKET
ncbi:uncharacterized protein TRUGW13939_09140 [Talaromyces rugulosus]|uniref:Uncharacterized protein n=1 Tax=Talaromyces rugulosus TaxID=121627 RepID=A0A7H8R6J1_TALRU|nr:uncharacterized protein TRUGW13939_09140 [Talaromyces rugulosus]QKX61984.1 hypothetical protein TRUGW13939_09140 [Talaromyces rugulosus]